MLIFNEVTSYHTYYPTSASREAVARTFGDNAAFTALMGPAGRLDTVGGWVPWRVLALLVWVGAIWGLLTATRLLRREEHAGAAVRLPGPDRTRSETARARRARPRARLARRRSQGR